MEDFVIMQIFQTADDLRMKKKLEKKEWSKFKLPWKFVYLFSIFNKYIRVHGLSFITP